MQAAEQLGRAASFASGGTYLVDWAGWLTVAIEVAQVSMRLAAVPTPPPKCPLLNISSLKRTRLFPGESASPLILSGLPPK
jgi:hypothetical protein